MWELFGDVDQPFRVVAADRTSNLEVFGLAEDGSVWQNVENAPDDWTGWSPFGQRPVLRRIFPTRSTPGLLTLGVNRSWRTYLRVFGAAPDGDAWMNNRTWPSGRWRGWRRFGFVSDLWGRIGGSDGWMRFGVVSQGLRDVVVPTTGAAWHVVFGLGVDDSVWINPEDVGGEEWRGDERWFGWREFGEGLLLSSLVIGRPDDLTIEAIGIAPDSTIWRNSAPYFNLAQWSGWQPFGAPGDRFRAVASLRTGSYDGSESDVFALALDDTIWRRAPGSTDWVQFGAPTDRLSTITPIWNSAGLAGELAGTAPDYSTWHAALLPSGQWGPLQPFGWPSDGLRQLTFAQGADLRQHAFGLDPDGAVWHKSQTAPGTWPPP